MELLDMPPELIVCVMDLCDIFVLSKFSTTCAFVNTFSGGKNAWLRALKRTYEISTSDSDTKGLLKQLKMQHYVLEFAGLYACKLERGEHVKTINIQPSPNWRRDINALGTVTLTYEIRYTHRTTISRRKGVCMLIGRCDYKANNKRNKRKRRQRKTLKQKQTIKEFKAIRISGIIPYSCSLSWDGYKTGTVVINDTYTPTTVEAIERFCEQKTYNY
mmetsp:Transcript_14239/g.15776  ORF Transcript_14239/g.15776 Transcript_14239/m.15776 type:complete len:217 (+) Transcript_14239:44-694(+)